MAVRGGILSYRVKRRDARALLNTCRCTKLRIAKAKRHGRHLNFKIPKNVERSVVRRLLQSIQAGSLISSLLYLPSREVLKAIHYLVSNVLFKWYVGSFFLHRSNDLDMCITMVMDVIRTYGLSDQGDHMDTFWHALSEALGISYEWVLEVRDPLGLVHKESLIEAYNKEQEEWELYWQYRDVRCAGCGFNMLEIKNFMKRRELVYSMPCCKATICGPCIRDFLFNNMESNLKNCTDCDTVYTLDLQQFRFTIDKDYDTLSRIHNRHNQMASANIPHWVDNSDYPFHVLHSNMLSDTFWDWAVGSPGHGQALYSRRLNYYTRRYRRDNPIDWGALYREGHPK